jgi:hypothetical protein
MIIEVEHIKLHLQFKLWLKTYIKQLEYNLYPS